MPYVLPSPSSDPDLAAHADFNVGRIQGFAAMVSEKAWRLSSAGRALRLAEKTGNAAAIEAAKDAWWRAYAEADSLRMHQWHI